MKFEERKDQSNSQGDFQHVYVESKRQKNVTGFYLGNQFCRKTMYDIYNLEFIKLAMGSGIFPTFDG